MSFDSFVNEMDATLLNEFGVAAVYNGVTACTVVIDRDVEQFGSFETQGAARRHEATFLVSEVPNPKRGQSLATDSGTFKIDGVISNDGFIVRVHINES